MNKEAIKYLAKNISSNPNKVDRLIITAYLKANNITVKKNEFLIESLITENDKKEFKSCVEFVSLVQNQDGKFTLENVIELFEFVISPSDRIVSGAVYTPKIIREYIVSEAINAYKDQLDDITIADISSGCGGFLYSAAQKLKQLTKHSYYEIYKRHLFGLDIQNYSIERTKILLTLLAITNGEDFPSYHFNLFTGDALEFDWRNHISRFGGFSIVVGNPPYVCSRNINKKTKKLIDNWEVSKTGHPDLYIPFFQIGIENLKNGGILGFITMNSFFKSLNGRAVREYFQKKRYKFRIFDFGTEQVFQSRNTYTCICFIQKMASNVIEYGKIGKDKMGSAKIETQINYSTLNFTKGWNLQNNDTISKIESIGIPFGELYKTRNGIATLKNNIYIFNPIGEDKLFYYLEDGFKIEKDVCKDIINPNRLTSQIEIKNFKEKIIFPYQYIDEKPKILTESFLLKNYPSTLKYLQSKKEILSQRDKGKGKYEKWFAFGRNQSLDKMKHKLFFPHITDKIPSYIINSDDNLLFYNGIAVIGNSLKELGLLKKIMESRLFWYYVTNSSKPYSSSYYSLSKNYIKNFGVYQFSNDEIEFILKENDQKKLDYFIEEKYGVCL